MTPRACKLLGIPPLAEIVRAEAASPSGVTVRLLVKKYPAIPEGEWDPIIKSMLRDEKSLRQEWTPVKQPDAPIQEGRYFFKGNP